MDAVKGLTKLKILWLVDNQIEKVPLLSSLTELEELGLHRNKIEDVSGIRGLAKLKIFTIKGNPIKNYTPVILYMKEHPSEMWKISVPLQMS